MAATFNVIADYEMGGMRCLHLRATADAANAVYTFPHVAAGAGAPKVLGVTCPVKSTGSAAALTALYSESTGNLTIGGLTGTDVIEYVVFLGTA